MKVLIGLLLILCLLHRQPEKYVTTDYIDLLKNSRGKPVLRHVLTLYQNMTLDNINAVIKIMSDTNHIRFNTYTNTDILTTAYDDSKASTTDRAFIRAYLYPAFLFRYIYSDPAAAQIGLGRTSPTVTLAAAAGALEDLLDSKVTNINPLMGDAPFTDSQDLLNQLNGTVVTPQMIRLFDSISSPFLKLLDQYTLVATFDPYA